MLNIEILPARHGDCLLIEYGTASESHYVLVDGGTPDTFDALCTRFQGIGSPAPLDLLVVTHIDEDHIGGALRLLAHPSPLVHPNDVWFNAYHHLLPPDRMGAKQGEALSTAIERGGFPWNGAFDGRSVVTPEDGELPRTSLAGGARVTLLSPTWKQLEGLRGKWKAEVRKAGMEPGRGAEPEDVLGKRSPPTSLDVEELAVVKSTSDSSKSNGSSIAFLFEYDGKCVLLAADAYPGVLLKSLKRFEAADVSLDALKVSHHGSRANTTTSLLRKVRCSRFLISTNGDIFGHPDPEAIAQIVKRPGRKELYFNYETEYTRPWSKSSLRMRYDYEVFFAEEGESEIVRL
jgi:hypothetical protein